MYHKQASPWRKHWDFILLDLIAMQLGMICAYAIFFHIWIYRNFIFSAVCLTMALCQLCVSVYYQPFKNVLKRGYYKEFVQTLNYAVLVVLVNLLVLFVLHYAGRVSRKTYVLGCVFYLTFSYVFRIGLKYFLRHHSRPGQGSRSVLVVSTPALVSGVLDSFSQPEFRDMHLSGTVLLNESDPQLPLSEIMVDGTGDTIMEYLCREWVDEVFIRLPESVHVPDDIMNEIISMGITVHTCLIAPVSDRVRYVERFGNYSVLTDSIKFVTARQMLLKRLLDILGGIVGCLLTIVIFIFVAPFIFIESPGPIFFRQTRVGRNGKTFQMYKFRSMYPDAEKRKQDYMEKNEIDNNLMFKMDNDPRIIGRKRVGKNGKRGGIGFFIRKTSLDEFPQFWNVLKGDMSLVGTRPPTMDEWEQYDLPHRVRMSIKPGITGLWQVSGRSKITDFNEVVRLDYQYIVNWDLGEDIKILLKTLVVVFKGEGAE